MTFSVTFEGPKDEAIETARKHCAGYVALGTMTEDQVAAILAFARNVPGTHLSGSISGYNQEASGTISARLTGRVQA